MPQKDKSSQESKPTFLFGDDNTEEQQALREAIYGRLMPNLQNIFPSEMGMSEAERQQFGSRAMGDLASAQAGEQGRIQEDMARRGLSGSGPEMKDLDMNRNRYASERARSLTDMEKFNMGLKRQDRDAFTGNVRQLLGSAGNESSGKSKGIGAQTPWG